MLGNGDGTFQSPQSFSTAPWGGSWIAVGDLNLDGYPDLVVMPYSVTGGPEPTQPYIYVNNTDGGFSGPSPVALAYGAVTIGDVNGDGIPDLVSSVGYIALGNGDGTFQPPKGYPLPSGFGPSQAVLADLRRNGLTDLVFIDGNGSTSVLLAATAGKFSDGEWIPVTGGAGCAAAADYNGDGRPDLAVATPTGVSILLGTGKANPAFKTGVSLTLPAGCLVTGDLNGDGIPDLLVPSDGTVVAFLGNGDGTFTQASVTSTPSGGYLALGDFNHDGKLDFATSGNLLALGNGDGTFQTPTPFVPTVPLEGFANITAGDVNNDGWPDVILTDDFYSNIYVLLNNQHGGFTESDFPAGSRRHLINPNQVLLVDLTGKGNLDIVVANTLGGAGAYLGGGSGTFTLKEDLVPANFTLGSSVVAVQDVNADGIPDLIMTQGGGGSTLGIYLGKSDGTFKTPFYVGAGPLPGDLVLENLHGQPVGFPDIVATDVTGGVTVLINATNRVQ